MLLLVLIGVTQTLAAGIIRHARYECGLHGRFEYCVDNTPGCVIGCYCHPGYYFDTETKVCEHNTKLTGGNRRADFSDTEVLTTNPPVTPTTSHMERNNTDLLDNKLDTITKDVDDLSDWLYKQFFNVVENQVINSTDEYELMNRRNARKINRKRRSKKKNKKGRMRITEDDSLFDSSDSKSDDSDDSDYSDDDDSWEQMPIKPKPKGNDNNHGHRKIVMIHKKPKPPLPSFVFLPDSGTNFYPPVGLQRPPIPMFPIVPVPPVLQPSLFPPPVFLLQQSNDCNDNKTVNPPVHSSSSQPEKDTTTTTTTDATPQPEMTTDATPQPEVTKNTPQPDVVGRGRSRGQNPPRHKMIRKVPNMRATKKYNKHNNMRPLDTMPNSQFGYLSDQDVHMKMQDSLMYDNFRKSLGSRYTTEADADVVNFKYLADLIRNVNVQNEMGRNNNNKYYKPNTSPFRRNNPTPFAPVTEESFYSKLGKEIANLVRKIETNSTGQHEVDIEIVPVDNYNDQVINDKGYVPQANPVINENVYVPRAYWDRFARSPNIDIIENHLSNPAMNSNEALNELENLVQRTATVQPQLSLSELESLIKIMDKNDYKKNFMANQSNNIKENTKDTKSQPSRINIRFIAPNSPPVLKVFSDSTLAKPKKTIIRSKSYITERPLRPKSKTLAKVIPMPTKDNSNRNKKINIHVSRIHQSKTERDLNRQYDYYQNKNLDYLMNSRNYDIITRGNQGINTRKGSIGNSFSRRDSSPLVRAAPYDNVKYFTNNGMLEQGFNRPLEPIKAHKMFSSEVVYRNNRPMYFENDFSDFFNR